MKKFFKQKKGITLIALVITIIVLLILAGISISMLSGDNGILQKVADSRELTGIAEVVENAKLDVLAQIAENKGEDISKDQLKTILDKYFEDIATLELPDDLSNSDIKLDANQTYGGYHDIELVKIYNGKFAKKEEGKAYAIGDYVTIKGEGFYVIKDSPLTETTVKLLTAKFVNTLTKKQDDNAKPVIFDNSTNIYAYSSIKTEVESYVTSLKINAVSCGLLSCDDLEDLKDETYLEIIYPNEEGEMSWWLDSPGCDDGYAWMGCLTPFVDFPGGTANYDWNEIDDKWGRCYLRPFIEILKTEIPG